MSSIDTTSGSLRTLSTGGGLQAGGFASVGFGSGIDGQRSFAETLGAIRRAEGLDAQSGRSEEDKARDAAEQLIATTLINPILKQVRESNNAAPPFGPTQAEKQFGSLLDAQLANEIVRGANFPLTDRLAQNLLRQSSGDPA